MSVRIEIILTIAVILTVSMLLGWRVEKFIASRPLAQRLTVAGGLTILSLPGLWYGVYYTHIIPESVWLYRLRSLPGSNLLLTWLIPAAVAWGTILPRLLKLPLCTIATAFVLVPFSKPLLRPLAEAELKDQWEGDACLQSTVSTCGPASAASILRLLGDEDITEKVLARDAWSTATGTEAWYLARAIQKRGHDTTFSFAGLHPSTPLPGILGVKVGENGHFIAVLRQDGTTVSLIDPLSGEETMPLEKLHDRYKPTGFFMGIR
jgi:hypothetical protein